MVPLVAYHLKRDAQLWYHLLTAEKEVVTWEVLKKDLHSRYGPTNYEDFFKDLMKRKQIGVVCATTRHNSRSSSVAMKKLPQLNKSVALLVV